MLPRACHWRWCPVRLCVRRGLVAVSASVNFQPPRADRQHKKKSAGRAARCRPRSLLIAPHARPPSRPPEGDPAIRGPGIRACGATVSGAEPAWARGIGRGRASGAGRTAHSRRTNRRRRVRDVRVRGEPRAARGQLRATCRLGRWGQARHGTRELAPVQAPAHMLGLFLRGALLLLLLPPVLVELFGFTVASLGFFFLFLYYSELYCEGSPMALMQIFRLCVVSFFFLVMLMHTVRVYVYALGWPSSF